MKVVYHPAVQSDISKILRYYDNINNHLGDEFWDELNSFISAASINPTRFHRGAKNRRRVNLKRFPFHFLFRKTNDGIRITVVRHNKQNPSFGLNRI